MDCDNTDECLADRLRPGNAGVNDAADHIALVGAAIAQLPAAHRRDLLVTADGAGATHAFLDWLCSLDRPETGTDTGVRVEYSVGWAVDKYTGPVVAALPPDAWTPMLTADGTPGTPARLDADSGPDTVGEVAELTGRLGRTTTPWPPGHRVFVRRVKPLRGTTPADLPGTGQLELDLRTAAAGWRYEAFATNTPGRTPAWLDARHRVHARVESRIRVGKQAGAARLPSQSLAVNTAWYRVQAIACDLLAWTRLLACPPDLARVEPATLQFRVLHAPALLTTTGHARTLRFPPDWPWTPHIQTIFHRLSELTGTAPPAPT